MINLNAHPWDKIMHMVIAVIIAAPFFVAGLPLVGAAAAIGLFYGREQFGHWKNHKDELIQSWFFWNWSRDGQWDWYVVAIAFIPLLAIWHHFYGLFPVATP